MTRDDGGFAPAQYQRGWREMVTFLIDFEIGSTEFPGVFNEKCE